MLSYNRLSIGSNSRLECKDSFDVYEGGTINGTATIMRDYIWSPIIWHDGVRKKVNFKSCAYCALDFEDPEISIVEMQNTFCDIPHIIGTTRNHRKAKGNLPPMDRFRVLLPFDRVIYNLDEYEWNMKCIINNYGADPACYDGARIYLPCVEIVSINKEGDEKITVNPKPSVKKAEKIADHGYRSDGVLTHFAEKWLSREMPQGQRNNICFRVACDLARAGINSPTALQMILKSPTYANITVTQKLFNEIAQAIKSGFFAASQGR